MSQYGRNDTQRVAAVLNNPMWAARGRHRPLSSTGAWTPSASIPERRKGCCRSLSCSHTLL